MGLAGSAALALHGRVPAAAGELARYARAEVEPFTRRLVIPPVLKPVRRGGTDLYVTRMRKAKVKILPGTRTPVWSFDGAFPGPTIKVRKGHPVVVRRINELGVPVSVHLHGGRVAPADDGQPTELIRPGDRYDYHYPNDQDAATLWYHDHAHHHVSRNNYKGLSGLYIIEDEAEDDLGLPKGDYDIPLILQDRSFRADGRFRFVDDHDQVLGDTYLVNGRPVPYFEVAARKYRFRILNASNSRGYELALDSGEPVTQIASDGGLLPAPYVASSIPLWPAERAEIVIDFSSHEVGSSVVLLDRPDPTDPSATRPIMRFDITREESDNSEVPPTLRSVPRMMPNMTQRQFDLSFNFNTNLWEINGKTFDPDRVDVRPTLGTTETWVFRNQSSVTHPMHIHLVRFQVLDRNNLPPSPGELGWKDTVAVGPAETVRVAMRFEGYKGRYVYHCHNLAHENHSMMGQMKIV